MRFQEAGGDGGGVGWLGGLKKLLSEQIDQTKRLEGELKKLKETFSMAQAEIVARTEHFRENAEKERQAFRDEKDIWKHDRTELEATIQRDRPLLRLVLPPLRPWVVAILIMRQAGGQAARKLKRGVVEWMHSRMRRRISGERWERVWRLRVI